MYTNHKRWKKLDNKKSIIYKPIIYISITEKNICETKKNNKKKKSNINIKKSFVGGIVESVYWSTNCLLKKSC